MDRECVKKIWFRNREKKREKKKGEGREGKRREEILSVSIECEREYRGNISKLRECNQTRGIGEEIIGASRGGLINC